MLGHRMADSLTKTCFVCRQDLPHSAFIKSVGRPDGLYPYCRKCDSAKRRALKYADPEKTKALIEQKRAYDAAYNAARKSHNCARSKARYQANPAAAKEYVRLWQQANPERVRAYKANTKAQRRAVERSGLTGRELLAWKRTQDKVCHWCGKKCAKRFHVDHYVPLSKGGLHVIENLVIACVTCNLGKHAKDPFDFAREKGRLL
jgi:5-methylcytosine-specific restriction endonuclease McrA